MSLVSRHRDRVLAKQSATGVKSTPRRSGDGTLKPANDNTDPRAPEHAQLLVQLGEDLRALSQIQSIEQKIERKAKILPKYDAWANGIAQAAAAAEDAGTLIGTDAILVQTMIWGIDTADFARAFPRAKLALRHGMDLPQRFERTLGCMIAEEFAETALKAMQTDNAHIADWQQLNQIASLTESEDMPDQARAKLFKSIGMAIGRVHDAAVKDNADLPAGGQRAALEASLAAFNRAFALHDKSGVKKMIEQRERELKALPAIEPSREPVTEGGGDGSDANDAESEDGKAAN